MGDFISTLALAFSRKERRVSQKLGKTSNVGNSVTKVDKSNHLVSREEWRRGSIVASHPAVLHPALLESDIVIHSG